MTQVELIDEVKASGLRGRGGAAFPTGVKWGFLQGSNRPNKYVLVNCEEGDPGAYNDKGLIESDPHTVVEGTIIAGRATGSNYGYIFIRHGHDGPIDRAKESIRQAYEHGLLGEDILGSGFSFDMEVALTGDSYVAGEETALMEAIEGKRSMPRFRPPFPAQAGVWGNPSNINNVKTLAYVPEMVRQGGEWFASIGYERSKGTAILCLTGDVNYPGMYEVPFGLTLGQVVNDIAGGVASGGPVKLLQTGGPLGGVLGPDSLEIMLDYEAHVAGGRHSRVRRHHRRLQRRVRRRPRVEHGRLLPVRIVRQVFPLPAWHDAPARHAGAHRVEQGQPRGPRPDAHHRQDDEHGVAVRPRAAGVQPNQLVAEAL